MAPCWRTTIAERAAMRLIRWGAAAGTVRSIPWLRSGLERSEAKFFLAAAGCDDEQTDGAD